MMLNYIVTIIAIFSGIGMIYLCYRKLSFGKSSILYAMACVPAFLFSTYMLTEAVTADEGRYIPLFGNIANIDETDVNYLRGTFQYRSTQIVIGTITKLIRNVMPAIEQNTVNVIYKYLHWLMFITVAMAIIYLWAKYIISCNRDSLKYRLIVVCISYLLIGQPVACLILKVCNYDAGNIYFALLGFTLVMVSEKTKNLWWARGAVLAASFCCIEKWSGLIYVLICISFAAFLNFEINKSTHRAFRAVLEIILGMAVLAAVCVLSLLYIRILQGNGIKNLNAGATLFPMLYMIRVFLGDGEFKLSGIDAYDTGNIQLIFVEFLLCLICFTLILFAKFLDKKFNVRGRSFLSLIDSVGLFSFVIMGILGCYFVKRFVYPFIDFPADVYQPAAFYNNTAHFYMTKTHIGHIIANLTFANATIIAFCPSVVLFLAIAGGCCLICSHTDMLSFFEKIFLTIGILLIPLFVMFHQPPCARYYGVSIFLISLFSALVVSRSDTLSIASRIGVNAKKGIAAAFSAIYIVEMIINLPLYNCFSPCWLIRSSDFYSTVRQGEWDAGEAMT